MPGHPEGTGQPVLPPVRLLRPCTVGIDIPNNFLMANYLRKYDLADWARGRYAGLAHHAGECVECGACESRCPYQLPIREMLKGVAAEFGY